MTCAHLLMRVTLQLIHCLIPLHAYRRMNAMIIAIPVDSFEISLFDDACYACGQDANMNYAYGDELAIVPYVKHEIVAIASTHDSPIIFLNFPTTLYRRSLHLLRIISMCCLLLLHMMILMNIICMCLLLLLAIIMRDELHLNLSMFLTQ